jgi:hypothetical protein
MTAVPAATGSVELIEVGDRETWKSALADLPHVFAHTWEHCHAIAASSGDRTYLYILRCQDACIVSPIAERPIGQHADVVTPYGLSGFVGTGDCPSLASLWREFAQSRGYVCGYLLLNPVLPNATYFGGVAKRHRTLFVLDLRRDEEELFARLSRNRKRQVRRGDANHDTLVHDRERLIDFFVRTYPDFMARRKAARAYTFTERTLRELCRSPNALVIGAKSGGRIRAVSLFGFTRYGGDALFEVSLPGEDSYSVMLIWAAMRELKARRVPTLNLGGGVKENDGVAEFKRRFGADEVPLRNVKQVYRRDIYEELCAEAGVDPHASAYFPAYRDPPVR